MLFENHSLRRPVYLAATAALSLACGMSNAEDKPVVDPQESVQEALRGAGPVLKELSPESRERALTDAARLTKNILDSYEKAVKRPETAQEMGQTKRFADSIADSALQAERDQVLEFLGLDPRAQSGLYIFVSWSMPLPLLRAYVLDAMWSGATLVFKGVPEGRTLSDFITKDLQSLVYGKSAAANISIDPRLFDAYQVKVVPTIVLTRVRANISCQGAEPVSFTFGEKSLSYDTCPALQDEDYLKVSGNVTTSFALERFKEKEPLGPAELHLKAIAKGFAQGVPPGKEQLGFEGKWESVLSPEEAERVKAVVQSAGSRISDVNLDTSTPESARQGAKP